MNLHTLHEERQTCSLDNLNLLAEHLPKSFLGMKSGETCGRVSWNSPKGVPEPCSHGPRCMHSIQLDGTRSPENTDMFALGCSCELLVPLRSLLFHGSIPGISFLRGPIQDKGFESLEPLTVDADKTFFLPLCWGSGKFDPGVHKAKKVVTQGTTCFPLSHPCILGHWGQTKFKAQILQQIHLYKIKALETSHLFCTYPIFKARWATLFCGVLNSCSAYVHWVLTQKPEVFVNPHFSLCITISLQVSSIQKPWLLMEKYIAVTRFQSLLAENKT